MKIYFNLYVLLFSIILISGCTEVSEQNKEQVEEPTETVDETNASSQNTYQFSHDNQDFVIIPFFEEMLEYTNQMKGNILELDQEGTYMDTVLKPFNEQASLDITLDNNLLLSPSWRTDELEENTTELIESQEQINLLIEEAITAASELLPGQGANIYVFPLNPEDWFPTENMDGVGGVAYSESDFILFLHPSFTEEALKYSVVHEYHHTLEFLYNAERSADSILDLIIIEGKADSFATLLYPEANVGWIEPLAEEEEVIILEELGKNIKSSDWNVYDKFVEGNAAQGIPMWSNYKIGYQMTQSFIENHPELSIEEWTKLNTKEIVKGSKYSHVLSD